VRQKHHGFIAKPPDHYKKELFGTERQAHIEEANLKAVTLLLSLILFYYSFSITTVPMLIE